MRARPALLAVLLAAACPLATSQVEPPAEARLRERVPPVHAAIGAKDVQAWYEATPPSARRRMGFEDFKRDIRWDSIGALSPPSQWRAELARVCSCRSGPVPRCVVSVRVEIQAPGKDPEHDAPLETWDYEAGEWYLAYIGASTNGRCPGER